MAVRLAELKKVNPGARLQYAWVPYQRISVQLKRAMIAAEDARFVEHEGFDWEGIQHAMDKNLKKGPRRRRRIDDLAAAREESVPVGRAQLLAQGRGSADHA